MTPRLVRVTINDMEWITITFGLLVAGSAGLLATVRRISGSHDERGHYALSIRFWAALAGMGALMALMFAAPLLGHAWLSEPSGKATLTLIVALPGLVVAVGLRNALTLARAMRRRDAALDRGLTVHGTVRRRTHLPLAHDLVRVEVDALLPGAAGHAPGYRGLDAPAGFVRRFAEICPGEHWDTLRPGTRVRLRIDPDRPERFALLLFDGSAAA